MKETKRIALLVGKEFENKGDNFMRQFSIWVFMVFLVSGMGWCKTSASVTEDPVYDDAKSVQPLMESEEVPDGNLKTIDGKEVELKTLTDSKLTVIIFYRGGWCPFCNMQMSQLIEIEPKLKDIGYQILAITPDSPESLRETMKRVPINYTLLSDSSMEVTRRFGLAYRVDKETLAAMKAHGADLEKRTGNSLHLLPVPAAYVVNRWGQIQFVYYNKDYRVRVKPEKLLEAAEEAVK
jgi:peroxiredoxin